MGVDLLKLRKADACRALNSTPLGTVTSTRQLDRYAQAGGWAVGDGKTINLVRLTAWLAHDRHHPALQPSYGEHRDRMGVRAREQSAERRDIGSLPDLIDPDRRRQASHDFQRFCEAYFPQSFHLPWSADQLYEGERTHIGWTAKYIVLPTLRPNGWTDGEAGVWSPEMTTGEVSSSSLPPTASSRATGSAAHCSGSTCSATRCSLRGSSRMSTSIPRSMSG